MTDKEYTEVNSALDFLQEFDDDEWYQEAFGIVFNYIIKLEKEIENLQDTISEEDAISRTEAIENFASWYGHDYNNQGYYRLLKQMPSVTPSYNSIKTELKLSGDCISREEALKVMCDKCPMYNCVTGYSSYRHIEKMPSVQPQPKRGKWIKYNVDIAPHPLHCSECGWSNHHLNRTIVSDFKHCPNCGADMRGEKV